MRPASVLVMCALAASACSSAPDNARIGVHVPDRGQFDPVGNVLDHRCGNLTCHGSAQRNFVIWGCEGRRLDPALVPGCRRMGGKDTTEAEFDATFRSLVGLEPATMSEVVAGNGKDPELLTFVRKARGWESHKGGSLFVPGDDQDRCVTSWLAGSTDTNACTSAMNVP